MNKLRKLTPEQFVRLWQESKSIRDFCEKTGRTYNAAYSRACYYRKLGVKLKRHKKTAKTIDVAELNAIIEQHDRLHDIANLPRRRSKTVKHKWNLDDSNNGGE